MDADTETPDDVRRLTEDVRALVGVVDDLRREREEDRGMLEELQITLAGGHRASGEAARLYPDWQTWVE